SRSVANYDSANAKGAAHKPRPFELTSSCCPGRFPMIEVEGLVQAVLLVQLAGDQYRGSVAMCADVCRIVRYDNHCPITASFEQLPIALFVEPGVAHGDDLVDKKTIELDDHRNREGEARPHPRRI